MSSLAPRSWLHLPRRTARMRLSLLYAGMFLLSGAVLLTVVYAVAAQSSTIAVQPVGALRISSHAVPAQLTGAAPAAPAAPSLTLVPGALVAHQHSADLSSLLAITWVALGVATLFSALFGWIAAGRVLRPLRTITTTARTISAGNLHERLALAGPDDEFKQLGDTLDELLGRLEASFEAQRRFVANASHELRTPLTLERTLLQVALADPNATAGALRSTCEELLASGRDHERLLEALLTLASSERGLEDRWPLDLSGIAQQALLTPRPEIERLGLEIETALAPAPTAGDPALTERLVANLIDNAVRYNHAGGRVVIATGTERGHATLSVANTGRLIAPEEIDRLFEPFRRLGADRATAGTDRHGLGLSIVRAIATAHGATITAGAQPTGGLAITVVFPAAVDA